MNKKIAAAVSSAALVLGSTAANAGIVIPAGEWTLDVNGNVNVYATFQNFDDASGTTVTGGLARTEDSRGESSNQSIATGLLPAWLGFTGTTRQNDLDVSFTISLQPSVSDNTTTGDQSTTLWRQAFLTFGDKSWGSVKMGKDLGIFAGNAILNDMTLLGVGSFYRNSGTATTLGGIGTGYIYPAWKGQIAYTTPNFNGFTATIGITNPNQLNNATLTQGFTGGAGMTTTKIVLVLKVKFNTHLIQVKFGYLAQVTKLKLMEQFHMTLKQLILVQTLTLVTSALQLTTTVVTVLVQQHLATWVLIPLVKHVIQTVVMSKLLM